MGKKKSKKISDSAYLKLQEMITDGLTCLGKHERSSEKLSVP